MSEVGVMGVTRLMRWHTSKATFWSAKLCSSGFGVASGLGAPSAFWSERGSPKRMWTLPYWR